MFRLDPVFVSVFRTQDRADEPVAREVEQRLAQALAVRHLVVPLDEVPPFEDYDAEVYLRSCPRDRQAGCAYVIGNRAQADWAVDGFVEVDAQGALIVDTTLVDVRGARTVVSFQVRLVDGVDETYVDAVASLIDRLAAEGTDPEDVRGDAAEDGRIAEREAIAASLQALEGELGAVALRDRGTALETPRLTAEDIAAWQAQEGAAPWERFDLTPGQYRRMRNARTDVQSWRRRLRGRAGQLVLRVDLTGGGGPFGVDYDGRWVIDAQTTEVVGLAARQTSTRGTSWGAEAEVGLGLLPWLDVAVVASSRATPLVWLLHPETLGDARVPEEPTTSLTGTGTVGGRVTVAPMPTAQVRPLGTAAVELWLGPGLDRVVDTSSIPALPTLDATRRALLRLGPGVEIEADPHLQFFARVELCLPVGGAAQAVVEQGDPGLLTYPAGPVSSAGVGLGGSVGVQVRLGPLWGPGR